jgi:hypothetical protein
MRVEVDMTFKQFLGLLILLALFCVFALLLRPAIDWELDNASRRAELNRHYFEICVDGDQPFDNGEW